MTLFRRRTNVPPEDPGVLKAKRREHRSRLFLSVLSGVMLGFSFPPSQLGELACFGLIPLLVVLSQVQRMRQALGYTYLAMLAFHIITLNWTGGYAHMNDPYMMIAGAVTMTVHPFFYFIPMSAYFFARKTFNEKTALLALPFFWVAYELSHSLTEWSFPWLTIGNSQSYDSARIQFISVTGIYGLSFWVLVLNVLGYLLVAALIQESARPFTRMNFALVGIIAVVFALPIVHGGFVLSKHPPVELALERNPQETITVGIVQANVDPWEKWSRMGYETIELYLRMTKELVDQSVPRRPDIVLWPETAMPYYMLVEANRSTLEHLRRGLDSIGVPVLTGLPQAVYYPDSATAPPSSKRDRVLGMRYDAFNATAFIQPGVAEIPWYGKMKMVPLAERVPYAEAFHFLDFMRWGVGIGGWQLGRDSVVYKEQKTGVRFSTPICYESVYPAYVASYVRKGAEFIAIVTIDSWWARMSGAFQHKQFALFRAVENRRWIARCAVGGISCYIDPYGRAFDTTELFTQATLNRTIGRSAEMTFYTEHGDWFAELCSFIGALFLAGAAGQRFFTRKREGVWQSSS